MIGFWQRFRELTTNAYKRKRCQNTALQIWSAPPWWSFHFPTRPKAGRNTRRQQTESGAKNTALQIWSAPPWWSFHFPTPPKASRNTRRQQIESGAKNTALQINGAVPKTPHCSTLVELSFSNAAEGRPQIPGDGKQKAVPKTPHSKFGVLHLGGAFTFQRGQRPAAIPDDSK